MKWLQHPAAGFVLKWGFASCLVVVVLFSVDLGILWQELSRLPVNLLVPTLVLTVFQVLLSAWRWRYTAGLLGAPLPFGTAVREYYLASFLNQLLPGGMLGDVNRAWRHGAVSGQPLDAIHGVAIERLSGQLVLGLTVTVALAWLMLSGTLVMASQWWMWLLPGLALFVVWLSRAVARSHVGMARYFRRLRGDIVRTLLKWPAFPVQMGTSLLVLASYLGVFMVLAYGAGYLGSWNALALTAALCSLLLLSMVIPVTVSGWGIREGAAALLWPMAGLPPEQGVALSVGYGALVFLSTLPGLVFLVTRLRRSGSRAFQPIRKSPDQRAYHFPD
ncbi:lysylphosphatidylglycerol synthase transmembrane domain-containing protein [Marinobacter sp. F4206]|uniref:lysylphosphatidylglycerol synthase transmembrane domain-containing protein n=1 Tax=Marinobacter sp. F4206 TaxID=2861777 RepID=UPI001C5FF29C|nr:lysylphosphatidylglycerol synthase transmembrane domain-containing protein [Marinobacter sp. F4206]MBW4933437.1 flippase-like domain-containing protein [Marinobacter sp. F4206]